MDPEQIRKDIQKVEEKIKNLEKEKKEKKERLEKKLRDLEKHASNNGWSWHEWRSEPYYFFMRDGHPEKLVNIKKGYRTGNINGMTMLLPDVRACICAEPYTPIYGIAAYKLAAEAVKHRCGPAFRLSPEMVESIARCEAYVNFDNSRDSS